MFSIVVLIFSLLCLPFPNQNLVPRPVLAAILIGACSVVGMFTPFYTSFTSLVVFSALYGVFGPVFFSICPVVIVDLLGLENLGPTLGFVTLFQAAAEGASHALTGHVTCFSGKDSCLSSRNRVTN